jgi:uncharacterized protein (DUF1330 family)
MPAYMIVHAKILDRDKFIKGYGTAAAALVEKFGGRYIMMASGAEVLEGDMDPDASVVISEWPDKATALQFWNSPEYAEVKKLREGIADARVVVIEAPAVS